MPLSNQVSSESRELSPAPGRRRGHRELKYKEKCNELLLVWPWKEDHGEDCGHLRDSLLMWGPQSQRHKGLNSATSLNEVGSTFFIRSRPGKTPAWGPPPWLWSCVACSRAPSPAHVDSDLQKLWDNEWVRCWGTRFVSICYLAGEN